MPALADSVRRCFASLYSERVVAYLRRMRLSPGSLGLGLVVQRMIAAECSGVLFTMDPVSGARDRVVIDAGPGLGAGVLGGRVSPQTVIVDKQTLRVTDAGRVRPPAPAPAREGAAEVAAPRILSEALAARIAEVGREVEQRLGMPVDV